MRILFVLNFIFIALFCFPTYSQIQTGELPSDFFNSKEKSNPIAYTVQLNDPSLVTIKAEDVVEDQLKGFGWRFGTLINANYDLTNSGLWSYNDNDGTASWKLKVSFQQAVSINLNFDLFKLSPNAKLFIYNDDFTDVLGAITAANNKEDLQFSIRPIRGNSISLALEVPQNEIENNSMSIHEIIYGYRSIHDKVQKVFKSSQSCNVNVNCSEGDDWQDSKRAVAMITSASNTRFCTGTLVNNVRQDSTPYVITAAHCSVRNNSIFIFGYESPLCDPNTDGSLTNSISGSSRISIAENLGSDFELRELSSIPPSSYNVYYAGWNSQNITSTKSVGIHHPTGDVMKISVDNDSLVTSGYYSTGTTHWEVQNWEKGTTEGGSSGSALFDANQRFIGQLHGGDAACGNNAQDYYGKFSQSWNSSSDTLRQLKHWLDPDGTGTIILDGMDPNPAVFDYDLTTLEIDGIPEFECTQTTSATFRVKNIGNLVIDSFSVAIEMNNTLIQTIQYKTPLARNGIAVFNPTPFLPLNGSNNLKITASIDGVVSDQDISNNNDSISFEVNTGSNEEIQIIVKTDNYGSETSWELRDLNSNIQVINSPSYPDISGGATYTDTFCIYNGCFRFNLFDSKSDGFTDPSGNFGNGFLLVTKNGRDTLFFENNFSSALSSDTFCTKFSTGLIEKDIKQPSVTVFPNPVIAGELLKITGEASNLKLMNITGQLLTETVGSTEIIVPNQLPRGIYFLEIRNSINKKLLDTKKVLVE